MKRSALQPSKKPIKRSPWPLADRATALRRSKLKARVKKPTVAEGSKYLAACRGEECYLRVPGVCTGALYQYSTVVPCHSNQSKHGKGMGIKAMHQFTVPGCATCHWWIDRSDMSRAKKFEIWDRAYERWEPVRAAKMGLGEEEAA